MKTVLSALILLFLFTGVQANLGDKIAFSGYVRETPILWQNSLSPASREPYVFTNNLHTRQNFRFYIDPALTAAVEIKSRLFNGHSVSQILSGTQILSTGTPYFDLSHTFIDKTHTLLISTLDRVWLSGTSGSMELTIGRQRIAWGTSLVWNPIDLFNPASPLDYDDEEKPGTDAVRFEWYTSPNAQLDIGIAPQRRADDAVAAVRYKTNRWNYDWMVLAGRRRSEAVVGAAWAGSIRGGGFRGELLWARPRETEPDHKPYLTAVVSGDYTFRDNSYLHGAVLFNQRGTTHDAGGLRQIIALQRGELTPARISLFAEAAADITPLIRIDLIGIFNPYDHSRFVEPSLRWSVITNLDLTVFGLIFGGRPGTEFGDAGNLLMARLKYSF